MANIPPKEETPPQIGRIDWSKEGHPSAELLPFVNLDWYKSNNFPGPRFVDAGVSDINLSVDASKRLQERWNKPFQLVTCVNLRLTKVRIGLPGPTIGSIIWAEVLPFHVVRTSFDVVKNVGMADVAHASFVPLHPRGSCGGAQYIKRVEKVQKGNEIEEVEELIPTCKFIGCELHPNLGMPHSIHQAYHAVDACGEPCIDSKREITYLPQLEWAEKELLQLMDIDKRPLVHLWVARRIAFLKHREARIRIMANQGKAVRGR